MLVANKAHSEIASLHDVELIDLACKVARNWRDMNRCQSANPVNPLDKSFTAILATVSDKPLTSEQALLFAEVKDVVAKHQAASVQALIKSYDLDYDSTELVRAVLQRAADGSEVCQKFVEIIDASTGPARDEQGNPITLTGEKLVSRLDANLVNQAKMISKHPEVLSLLASNPRPETQALAVAPAALQH